MKVFRLRGKSGIEIEANQPKGNGRHRYEEFLLREYDNIAQAHFNTVNTISAFFKHYLLIVTLPIPLFAFLLKIGGTKDTKIITLIMSLGLGAPIGSLLIGVVGFCVLCYISNLRFDAILYARTVNGIRKYFINRSGLTFAEEGRVRVLPKSIGQPRYFEPLFFLWVVIAFGLLNALYFGVGVHLLYKIIGYSSYWILWFLAFLGFACVNVLGYWVIGRYRENRYLRSRIIGVDIDGVLNRHREHFCDLLKMLCQKELDPLTITRIPVHECKTLRNMQGDFVSVDEKEEHVIFNHPQYWEDMPLYEEAIDKLRRLRNIFQYKIFIFTHRPWPDRRTFPEEKVHEYERLWLRACLTRKGKVAMKRITKEWLSQNEIPYDKLVVEAGNIHTADSGTKARNRFVLSEKKGISLFVEDDLAKAKKLSHACELIFLLDQPYNQCIGGKLPYNILRVKSWQEIYEYIRDTL